MRRWERHRTRSKVALLLLINLVALLGGKYLALITIVKIELFGDAVAFAKVPKKKLPNSHLSRAPGDSLPPATPTQTPAKPGENQRGPGSLLLHVIHRGETLSAIAASYGISVDALRRANHLGRTSHAIVGETLRIPPREGMPEIAALPQTLTASDRALFRGVPRHLKRRTQAPVKGRPDFSWPVAGLLTSPFGERDDVMGGGGTQFHAGIDISVPTGTPVRAAQEGIVAYAGDDGAYGKAVKLDHRHGFSTLYAHNARILVRAGQTVKAGQVICLSGSTGRSTGPHLHFEVHKERSPVDPLAYLY
jgi:murein DD-endopeptidase MepM/ murein hydrolase activator NlpD